MMCALEIGPAQSASFTISRRGACATSAIPRRKVDDQVVVVAAAAVAWRGTTCALETGNATTASSTTLPLEISASDATTLNDVHFSPS